MPDIKIAIAEALGYLQIENDVATQKMVNQTFMRWDDRKLSVDDLEIAAGGNMDVQAEYRDKQN